MVHTVNMSSINTSHVGTKSTPQFTLFIRVLKAIIKIFIVEIANFKVKEYGLYYSKRK